MKLNKLTYQFIPGDKPKLQEVVKFSLTTQDSAKNAHTPKEIDLTQPVEIIDSVEEEKKDKLQVIQPDVIKEPPNPAWLAGIGFGGLIVGGIIGYFMDGD